MRTIKLNSCIFILTLFLAKPTAALDFDTSLYCVTAFNTVVGVLTVASAVKMHRTHKTAPQRLSKVKINVADGPVRDEINRHAVSDLNFFREVQRLEDELPRGESELTQQHNDRITLRERIESNPKKQNILTPAEAQYLLALEKRQGSLTERQERFEQLIKLIKEDPAHRKHTEADETLAIDVIFLALRTGDAATKERAVLDLIGFAQGVGTYPNIRLRAMYKLAELEKHEYLNELADFERIQQTLTGESDSEGNRVLLLKTLQLWPDEILLKWIAANGLPKPETLSPDQNLLLGRSPKLLESIYPLVPEAACTVITTIASLRSEDAIISLSRIAKLEIMNPTQQGKAPLFTLIHELGKRSELSALQILHEIELLSTEPIFKKMAKTQILKMISPEAGHVPGLEPKRGMPYGEGINFDALIEEITISRKGVKIPAYEKLILHAEFARLGNSAYVDSREVEWISKNAFGDSRFSEGQLIEMLNKWSDTALTLWIKSPGFRRMSPQGRERLFEDRPLEFTLNTTLLTQHSQAQICAIRSLKGKFHTLMIPSLNSIIKNTLLHESDPAVKRDIFEAVIHSLKQHRNMKALRLLDHIFQSSTDVTIQQLAQSTFIDNANLLYFLMREGTLDTRSDFKKNNEINELLGDESINYQILGALLLRRLSPTVLARTDSPISTALKADSIQVRLTALRSLKNRSEPEVLEVLSNALKDPNQYTEVRIEALKVLKELGISPAQRIIAQARTFDLEPVRRMAIELDNQNRSQTTVRNTRAVKDLAHFSEIPGIHGGFHKAATVVYYAPDAANFKNGEAMADAYERFERLLPLEQKLRNIHTDVLSSFKAYTSESDSDSQKVLHVSVAGSEDLIDWLVNPSHGTPQITNPAYAALREEVLEWAKQNPKGRVDITGHSLGAVAATAIGVELKTFVPQGPKIRVVTWNGLGAVQALRRAGIYNAESAGQLEIMNYRVHGDLVSRAGTPVGKHVTLPGFTRGILGAPARLLSMVTQSAHYMDLTNVIGLTTDAKTLSPPQSILRLTPITAPLSYLFGFIPTNLRYGYYYINEASYLKKLEDADRIWQNRRGKLDGAQAFRPFIKEIEIIKNRIAKRKVYVIVF